MDGQSENRKKIIDRYMEKVHGKIPDTSGFEEKHDGKEGHWLEVEMGIEPNGVNDADLFDHEMKNQTTSKTSYGDWSPDYWIFRDEQYDTFKSLEKSQRRDRFMEIFGQPRPDGKEGHSWSGKPIPKINQVNEFGVDSIIDADKNIIFRYFFSKDTRENKNEQVPVELQQEGIVIARWDADSIKEKIENKFNKMGWYKCTKGKNGAYESIVFGEPMDRDAWFGHVSKGEIFFDCGMYHGNSRNYCQWRASNSFWKSLITERHP